MVKLALQKKRGATSTYTEELGNEITMAIATSCDSIGDLCEKNSHWPSFQTIYEWRILRKDFGEMYTKAKAAQVECLVDRALKISRDRTHDYLENSEGILVGNSTAVFRARVEIDTIKWFACKLAPKIYGDKVQQDIKVTTQEQSIKELK